MNSVIVDDSIIDTIDLTQFSVSLRITITVILEMSLASFFGYLMCLSIKRFNGSRASIITLVSVIAILSAWVSFFNIEFVLLGGIAINGIWSFIGLFGLFVIAWLLGSIFIAAHFDQLECEYQKEFCKVGIPVLIQAGAFMLIYIGAVIG